MDVNKLNDAKMAALARKVLAIQMETGWHAKRESDGLWRVWDQWERKPPNLVCILSKCDPFSAIIAAKEWSKSMEKKEGSK